MGFLRKNRVKITVVLDLTFIGYTVAWLRHLFGLGPIGWVWRINWGITRWQGWTYYIGLLGVPLGGHLGLYRVLFGYGHKAIWGYLSCSLTQKSFCHHL